MMDNSSQQALITALQLARLKLTGFFSEGSGLTPSMPPDERGTQSNPGNGAATKDGPAVELAWEIAQTAQFCAYLAIELQVWAQRCSDQEPTLADSTYNRLCGSVGIFRTLVSSMYTRFSKINKEADVNSVCCISEGLAEAILSTWAQGNPITTVVSMTSTESQETSSTDHAGDTR